MSFRNVYYDTYSSRIHLWETKDGERVYNSFKWCPYLFLPCEEGEHNAYSLDGVPVQKKEFSSYKKYKTWNDDRSIKKYEDKVKPELQFLAEKYYQIPDEELPIPDLNTCSIDIEVVSQSGFPDPLEAKWPIPSITLSKNNTLITFGLHSYHGKDNKYYVHCNSEEELLRKACSFIGKMDIDVLTGWNISGFDLPYLYNRCRALFGNKNIFDQVSPIGITNVWLTRDESGLNIDIAGVSILDYMELYKKYTTNNPESYKLDDVCEEELDEKKLEYEGTLKDLYYNDWEKYIDYNRKDVDLVLRLEQKLGFIKMVQSLSLVSKCPMKFYDKVTNLIESIFLTHYRRNGLCAPKFEGGKTQNFEAAYVKSPQKGLHSWVVDLDVTSMYPHIMMTLNMSNETYIGCIQDTQEEKMVEMVQKKGLEPFSIKLKDGSVKKVKGKDLEKWNSALEQKIVAIAPNGAVFRNSPEGVVPQIEKKFFKMRKEVKNRMIQKKKDGGDEVEISNLNTKQLATKVLLNSIN